MALRSLLRCKCEAHVSLRFYASAKEQRRNGGVEKLAADKPTTEINLGATLAVNKTHDFFEVHPITLVLILSVPLGSPLLGLLIASWKGWFLGLVLGVFYMVIGIQAVTRVRGKRRLVDAKSSLAAYPQDALTVLNAPRGT